MNTSEIKKGVIIMHQGEPMKFVDFQHVKPGKGGAFIRSKLKGVQSGRVIEVTFRSGENLEEANIEYAMAQYLYQDGDNYVFMVNDIFEQHTINGDMIGENSRFIKENTEVKLVLLDGNPIDLSLPTKLDFIVTEASPAVQGDTSTSITKEVMIETGATIKVPGFVVEGDTIRVNTETGEYDTRV